MSTKKSAGSRIGISEPRFTGKMHSLWSGSLRNEHSTTRAPITTAARMVALP
jgi:hypothetical protein